MAEPQDTHDGAPAVSEWLVPLYANLGHAFTHMFTVLYATAVLYLPGVFGLPYGEMLGYSSLGLVLFGVGALPAGWLADRWSRLGMMVVFFVGLGAGTVITGLATGTAGLVTGLTLLGLFASIYHPVGIAWLVASAHRQGMSLGINGVFGNLGSALAPVFVGVSIDYLSWRVAFVLPGLVSIAAGLLLALSWWRGELVDVAGDRAPAPPPAPGAARRVFVVLTLTMAANGFVYFGVATSMPKLFETGLGPALASGYTQIGLFVGLVIGLSSFTGILGGWLADRYSARAIYLVFWVLLALPLFALTSLTGTTLLVAAFLALAFNIAFAAAENMLVARYTPFEWRSLAYGAKFVLALGVGGVTVKLVGVVYDRTGAFDLLYQGFGLAALAAAACALALPGARAPLPAR